MCVYLHVPIKFRILYVHDFINNGSHYFLKPSKLKNKKDALFYRRFVPSSLFSEDLCSSLLF